MGNTVHGREPADAPPSRRQRPNVCEVQPPSVVATRVQLVARPSLHRLKAGIPELVEEADAVCQTEMVVEEQRFERLIPFPLLEQTEPDVYDAPGLTDALAAGVKQVFTVQGAEPGPKRGGSDRQAGVRECLAEHPERVCIALGPNGPRARLSEATRTEHANW